MGASEVAGMLIFMFIVFLGALFVVSVDVFEDGYKAGYGAGVAGLPYCVNQMTDCDKREPKQ